MFKKQNIIIFLLVALVLSLPGGWLNAAYNDFQTNADVTVTLTSPAVTLTVKNSSNVESMTVGSGSISITLQPSSSIIIESADKYEIGSSGFSSVSFGCPSTGASTLTISSPAAGGTGTVTVNPTICTGSSGTSGGSTSSETTTPPPVVTEGAPTNGSLKVNLNATETTSKNVTLALLAENATEMLISNVSGFAGAEWGAYAVSKAWILKDGLGKKTVYAKFRNSIGESAVVSYSIFLVPEPAASVITSLVGGKVSLADEVVSVTVPQEGFSDNATVGITSKTSYVAPEAGKNVLGEQAFDITAKKIDGTAINNFNKNLTLKFKYTQEQLGNLSEATIGAYYYDETLSKWIKASSTVDMENKVVTATVDHFTLFTLLAEQGSSNSGKVIKLTCDGTNASLCSAVYYVGANDKRYVFPNEKIYFSWYSDFSNVVEVNASQLASYMIGGNVNYKPGVKMIKIDTDPKVYAVGKNGLLRWVQDENVAIALYGNDWNKKVDDLSDALFFNYKVGVKITSGADFDVSAVKNAVLTINADKSL